MTTQSDYRKYNNLQAKLEDELKKSQGVNRQVMPDDVWDDVVRRDEWLKADVAQWNFNTERLACLKRLYDKCFPKKEWVIEEIEKFFKDEEGPLY